VAGLSSPKARYLALWRLLRDELGRSDPTWLALPADTRQPDHTIWHHVDLASGLHEALSDAGGLALLSFVLGPVQPFIESARTVRDLWSGSFILSWLTFQAMVPVIDACGPAAFVYPTLRGAPLMDHWLREHGSLAEKLAPPKSQDDVTRMLTPCLPNRFLAAVPWGHDGERAAALSEACERRARDAWREISGAVRRELARAVDNGATDAWADWDRHWQTQVDSFFEVRTSVLRRRDCDERALARLLSEEPTFERAFPDADMVRKLADAMPEAHRPRYEQKGAGLWQAQIELSARVMAARRSVRHFPVTAGDGLVPPKCSQMGTLEQMGPADLEQSRKFWQWAQLELSLRGSRLRSGERLCAVALAKRFAWAAFFADRLRLDPSERRFPDAATVAAAQWLATAGIDPDDVWRRDRSWSGQWLHWERPDQDEDADRVPDAVWKAIRAGRAKDRPPTYLAVLVMDGDRIGQWLRGQKAPAVKEVLAPQMLRYWEGVPNAADGLAARRPVGGALHAAISEALANFALDFVPRLVANHSGTLIYAGGDDVLALLPVATAVGCALALRQTYRREWDEAEGGARRLLMGGRATISAGIAVVHHKEDLRHALDRARRAEKGAKRYGRDALVIAACRRSGEHTSVLVPWDFAEAFGSWLERFRRGATDRWAYRARAELGTLGGLPPEAQKAELLRLVKRSGRDDTAEEAFDPDALGKDLDAYVHLGRQRGLSADQALGDFVGAAQTASFMARGREDR
jgi:CRISPR-associated protein Cmr2